MSIEYEERSLTQRIALFNNVYEDTLTLIIHHRNKRNRYQFGKADNIISAMNHYSYKEAQLVLDGYSIAKESQ